MCVYMCMIRLTVRGGPQLNLNYSLMRFKVIVFFGASLSLWAVNDSH